LICGMELKSGGGDGDSATDGGPMGPSAFSLSTGFVGGGSGSGSGSAANAADFRTYASTEVQAFASQSSKERTEAMEALLVLLYDRMDGGVNRFDYGLLMLTVGSRAAVEVGWSGGSGRGDAGRWTKLSALVLAEAAALWRATAAAGASSSSLSSSSASDNMDEEGAGPASQESFPAWVVDHPLLYGLVSSDPATAQSAVAELDALGKAVRGYAYSIQSRVASSMSDATEGTTVASIVEAPEAVGLLAYGLLLRLVGTACATNSPTYIADVAKTLASTGTDYVTAAMNEYAAFDYLYGVLSSLLPSPTAGLMNKTMAVSEDEDDEYPDLPGNETMRLADDGADAQERGGGEDGEDASVVAYASIGREVLAGTIAAFRSVLLSSLSSPENLEMLCNLAASVYRNSSVLCDAFWSDWNVYCSVRASMASAGVTQRIVPDADPVCHLLDAAFSMASTALARAWSSPTVAGTIVNEGQRCAEALPSIAPLLRLLSSLVPANGNSAGSSTPSSNDVFSSFLPDRTVHTILVGCAGLCGDDIGAVPTVDDRIRQGAVESITALAHLIRISSLRNEELGSPLRSSLEISSSAGAGIAAGPRLLHFVASRAATLASGEGWSEGAAKMSAASLDITTDLILASSDDVAWMAECCLRFSQTRTGAGGFATFSSIVRDGTKNLPVLSSAMMLLSAMSSQMDRLAFAGTAQDVDILSEVISTIGNGLLIACDVLTSMPLATEESSVSLHHDTIHAVLASLQKSLRSIGEVIAAHASAVVRDTAKAVRDGVINFIATSTQTGNVVAYYATLPVSVSLVMELEKVSEGQSMFVGVAAGQEDGEDDTEDSTRKYGAWARLAQDIGEATGNESTPRTLQSFSEALVRNILALPMVASPDQGSSKVKDITKSALALLLQWGEHAEAIALERHGYASSYGNGLAIEDAAAVVAPDTGKAMAADLQTLSPLRLLLSYAPNPFRPSSSIGGLVSVKNNAQGTLMSNLNLLSRFLGDSTEGNTSDATVRIIAMALRHADAIAALSVGGSTRPGNLSVVQALGGGEQVHQSLLRLLQVSTDAAPSDQRVLMRTSQMVDVLTLSIDAQPALARMLLVGTTDHSGSKNDLSVVKSMAKAIKKTLESISADGTCGLSLEELSLASSCLDAFAALWRTSRSRPSAKLGAADNGNNSALLHPCDDIIGDVIRASDIVDDCLTLLTQHEGFIDVQSTGGCDKVASLKIDICSSVLEILANELFAGLRLNDVGKEQKTAANILDQISKSGTISDCSMSFTSLSGAAESADALSDLLQNSGGNIDASRFASLHSSPGKLDARVSLIIRRAISTMKKVGGEDSSGSIVEPLTKYYYAEKLSHSQLLLIKGFSRFSQVFFSSAITKGSTSDSQNPSTLDPKAPVISTADSILNSLEKNSATATTASSSSSHLSSTSYLTGKMGCHLCSLLAQLLGECYHLPQDGQVNNLLNMVGRLGKVAISLFSITRPIQLAASDSNNISGGAQRGNASFVVWAQKRAYRVACLLRLRILTCGLTLINVVGKASALSTTASPSSPSHRRFNDACITFTKLASEALAELQYSPSPEEAAGLRAELSAFAPPSVGAHFCYSFDVASSSEHGSRPIDSASDIEAVSGDGSLALALLKVSISSLFSIVRTSTNVSSDSSSFHSALYVQRLSSSMQDAGTVAALFRHLDAASRVAAGSYASKINNPSFKPNHLAEDNALDIIRLILSLLEHASCCTSGISLPTLLIDQHTVRVLTENPLLHTACQHWHATSMAEANQATHLRGYLTSGSTNGTIPVYREDPAHCIWRATLRTLTALLRSFRISDHSSHPGRGLDVHHKECLRGVEQFMSTFDALVISCLQSCSFSMKSSEPRHGNGIGWLSSMPRKSSIDHLISFTSCSLTEGADMLALISELCTGVHKKEFERSHFELYQAVVTASLNVSKALSCFLGASGTARELFSSLASFNKVMEENTSTDGSITEEAIAIAAAGFHPLMSEGVATARHDAIRYAYFASSCCVKMTPEEYAMSLEPSKSEGSRASGATPSDPATPTDTSNENVEQNFQIHVDNVFLVRMEGVAAECMFNSLNVLCKTHPAIDSFICFTPSEASRLDAMALVQLDMIIALRVCHAQQSTMDSEPDAIEYARVVDADYLRQTWDVETFPAVGDNSTKKRVSASLLAGMEDVANRKCILSYSPAPKISSDESNLAAAPLSIGHLILALWWCHQQAAADSESVFPPLVKCLAEQTALLLGLEVSLHQELGTATGEDSVRKINAQILELFDEKVMRSLDLLSGEQNESLSKIGLERILDEDVWIAVISQLQDSLVAARRDREASVEQWKADTGGAGVYTDSWGASTRPGKSNRRSPFRASMLRSLSL